MRVLFDDSVTIEPMELVQVRLVVLKVKDRLVQVRIIPMRVILCSLLASYTRSSQGI